MSSRWTAQAFPLFLQALDANAALDFGPGRGRELQKRLVEDAAGQALGLKGEFIRHSIGVPRKPDIPDGKGAQPFERNAKAVEIAHALVADKFSANLVMGRFLFLEENDGAACARQLCGQRGPGHASSNNSGIIRFHGVSFTLEMHSLNGIHDFILVAPSRSPASCKSRTQS